MTVVDLDKLTEIAVVAAKVKAAKSDYEQALDAFNKAQAELDRLESELRSAIVAAGLSFGSAAEPNPKDSPASQDDVALEPSPDDTPPAPEPETIVVEKDAEASASVKPAKVRKDASAPLPPGVMLKVDYARRLGYPEGKNLKSLLKSGAIPAEAIDESNRIIVAKADVGILAAFERGRCKQDAVNRVLAAQAKDRGEESAQAEETTGQVETETGAFVEPAEPGIDVPAAEDLEPAQQEETSVDEPASDPIPDDLPDVVANAEDESVPPDIAIDLEDAPRFPETLKLKVGVPSVNESQREAPKPARITSGGDISPDDIERAINILADHDIIVMDAGDGHWLVDEPGKRQWRVKAPALLFKAEALFRTANGTKAA